MENRIYADSFGIFASLTDLKIDFARIDPQLDHEGKILGDHRVVEQRIILSVPLAKELAKGLAAAVAEYEQKFGAVMDLEKFKKEQGQV